MKKSIFFSFLLFILGMSTGMSQEYLELIQNPKANTTLQEVQQKAEAYFATRDKGRGSGYKQYKRWEYKMQRLVNADGKIAKNFSKLNWEAARKLNLGSQSVGNRMPVGWTDLGPTSFTVGNQGYSAGLGRVNVIGFHPTDANTFYIGTPAGGLWRTTDGGATWTVMADMLASIGVSGISVDHTTPSTIYILTGDGDAGDTQSIGVLKSTDSGATWAPTGLSWGVTNFNRGYKLLMHPTNSNIMFAATTVGLLKTTDGWNTWSTVQSGNFRDIEFKPGDPSTVYAVSTNTFYKSTNTGTSFSVISSGLPTGESRIAIAVTPANANYVYYLAGPGGFSGAGTYRGMYRSTDSGTTFSTMSTSPNILEGSTGGGGSGDQSWYDLAIAVDQTNANNVVSGGVNVFRSTDGGVNHVNSAHWVIGGQYVHADIHDLVYNPLNNNLYCGSDGGISVSTDHGVTWNNIWDGLGIMQLYRIAGVDSNPNLLIGGAQDNGSNKYTGTTTIEQIYGADGMDCMINYNDNNTLYYSFQNGGLRRSTNGGNTATGIKPPGSIGSWVTPYAMDATNPNIIYGGYSDVFRSTDSGTTWTNLGSDGRGAFAVGVNDPTRLYAAVGSAIQTSANTGGSWTTITGSWPGLTITFIAVDPADANRVWITLGGYTAGEKVYESTNAGATWTNISGALPNLPAHCIAFENTGGTPADALYIGMSVGVYYTSDVTPWQLYETGLPNVPVYDLEINETSGLIRASTYGRGIWEAPLFGGAPPTNDLCLNADPITCGQTVSGDTTMATFDGAPFCDTSNTAPGVWYTFTGIEGITNLSTCNQASYDTKISVYSGTCGTLVCEAGQDDNFGAGCLNFTTSLDVCTQAGVTYYVLVHGFASATGTFDLTMTCTPLNVSLTCPPTQNVEGCSAADAPPAFANFTEFQTAGGSTVDGDTATFALINEVSSGGFPVTITRTYEIADVCGNTATCDHIIIVEDTINPVMACPADIMANTDAGQCSAVVTYADASAIDACGIASVVQTSPDPLVLSSGDAFPVGTTTVTFTATDVNGNTSTCSFDIIVEDNEDPVIACQDITVELDANGDYNLTPGEVLASSSDNCGIAS
ncbi:HYR domain-containing protein, partial [Aureisphaera sp. CAU 1614]